MKSSSGPESDRRSYDVVHVSDFRFPGGTSGSNAMEMAVQVRFGLKSAAVELSSPGLAPKKFWRRKGPFQRRRPVHPAIQELLDSGRVDFLPRSVLPVIARVAIFRHPSILNRDNELLPPLAVDHVVLVVNHPPTFLGRREEYDLSDAVERLRQAYGVEPMVCPISPLVGQSLLTHCGNAVSLGQNWFNVLDGEFVGDERELPTGRPLRVGRHSRPGFEKWPGSTESLRAAYFVDSDREVHILGGARVPVKMLGGVPENWRVHEFGGRDIAEFLQTIDVFIYFHHEHWVEAFSRSVQEAMAKGVPVILPSSFKVLYGPAALYARPEEVPMLVRALESDKGLYRESSRRGIEFVRANCNPDCHIKRLKKIYMEKPRAPCHVGAVSYSSSAQATVNRKLPGKVRRWGWLSRRGSVVLTVPTDLVKFTKNASEWDSYLKRWPWWVCGGSWDLGGKERSTPRESQIRELIEGRRPEQTAQYQAMLHELAEGGRTNSPRLYSRNEIDAYFADLQRLIQTIRADGYRRQSDVGGRDKHEITVRIDRHGRLLKCREGTHRLAIARILGVPRVAITVDLVHLEWFQYCLARWPGPARSAVTRGLSEFGEVVSGP